MRSLQVALFAALSPLASASLQVVPGGTWTAVGYPPYAASLVINCHLPNGLKSDGAYPAIAPIPPTPVPRPPFYPNTTP